MDDGSTSDWMEFLRALNPTGEAWISPQWHMSNGASFFMTVPAASDVFANSLAKECEFPFALQEIIALEFREKLWLGRQPVLSCDLEAIRNVATAQGFDIENLEGRMIVTLRKESPNSG